MTDAETPRWEQRYANFLKATKNLADGVDEYRQRRTSVLEQAGLAKLFEIAWESGWKVLRDYLVFSGITDDVRSPVGAIRSAYAINLIQDGQRWMDATKLRHTLTHEYHPERAAEGLDLIADEYLAMFQGLAEKLADEVQRPRFP